MSTLKQGVAFLPSGNRLGNIISSMVYPTQPQELVISVSQFNFQVIFILKEPGSSLRK